MKLFTKEFIFLINLVLISIILIDDVQGNIESLLCNSTILLVKGKLIGQIPKLDKEFLVSFDVFPNKFVAGWHSVIHFTIGSNWGNYGDRVPGIWFHENGSGGLYISAPINGNHDLSFTTNPMQTNHWSNVKVSQISKNSGYVYTIIINGEVVFTCENNNVQSFNSVLVYASDDWHDAQDGLIRNLFISNGISSNVLHPIVVLPANIDECANLINYCDWANIDCVNTNGYYFTCKCVAYYSMYCNWENSACFNTKQTIYFTCKSGWRLKNNSCVDINECANLTEYCNWANSGCVNTNGSYYCTCKPGWRLNNNSCVDVNECNELAKYCDLTNSDCRNTNGSYICTCKSGWVLENNSCVDVNKSNELAKYCNFTNSDYENTNGSYNCTCKSGCVDVNEYNELAKYCNLTNSDCENTNVSYNCTCKSGWILENNSCVDVNKCNELAKYCNFTNSDCENTNGSYNCTCKSGWILENNSCVDVNECNEMAKYCNLTSSDCKNTNRSYSCTCKSGWILENNSCVDINECNELAKYCNLTNSDCENTNGNFSCTCKSRWIFENNSCVDVNECNELAKYCNFTNSDCKNTNGSYNCTCKSGWILKNNSCIDINECNELAEPCNLTNTDCVNTNGSFNCTCKSGWILKNNSCADVNECDSSIDLCYATNTVCVNSIGSYYCYKGEWSTWSECSVTCGSGYKYSILNTQGKSEQEANRSLPCMNTKCSVDGNWSNWTTYKSCLDSCGICYTRLERYCNNPAPDNGGHDCFGNNVQYHENNTICRVNGGWTQWSSWSLCSQPCQGGVKTRYRSCTNPVQKYGGLLCNGNNTDEITCYSDKCKNVTANFSIIFTDEDYKVQYSNPSDEIYKRFEDKIKTAIENLYNKFNITVSFNLKLNSIKNGKDYQTKP
ncbi:fibrillin-1 isoform X3 [Hydra vulgaris]|uniref:fibrillin-1 isoform X3 n=1 Tax=Hydra vulgaris TaxID=6087 RepID=UPI0032EA664A